MGSLLTATTPSIIRNFFASSSMGEHWGEVPDMISPIKFSELNSTPFKQLSHAPGSWTPGAMPQTASTPTPRLQLPSIFEDELSPRATPGTPTTPSNRVSRASRRAAHELLALATPCVSRSRAKTQVPFTPPTASSTAAPTSALRRSTRRPAPGVHGRSPYKA